MKWLIPLLLILAGCNSVEPEMTEVNGITQVESRPFITNLQIPPSGTYDTTTPLTFTAVFSRPVTVFGSPKIVIITEFGMYNAFSSVPPGSHVSTIEFSYTPMIGNSDANGIQYSSSIVLGFGGSIYDPATNLDANLSLPAMNTSGTVISTGTGPVPTVSGTYGGSGDTLYGIGSNIELSLNFSEPVFAVGGTPSITLNIGGSLKTAVFDASTNGTNSLKFNYVVEEGIQGTNITGAIVMSGTFQDSDQNIAIMNVDPNTQIDVDGIRPYITSSTAPARLSFSNGIPLTTFISWSEPMYVSNPALPRIKFTIDNGARSMNLSTWTNGQSGMTFVYNPETTDVSVMPLDIAATLIDPSGAIISDLAGNLPANLIYPLPLSLSSYRIAPATMDMWYDLSYYTPGTSTTTLTSFLDLLAVRNGTPGANIGYNGFSAQFSPVNAVVLNSTYTADYVVLVVENTSSGIVISNTINETMLNIASGYISSNNCADSCRYLDETLTWQNSTSSNLGSWLGSTSTRKIIAVNLNGMYYNRTLRFRNMKLYEAHFYSSSATEAEILFYVQRLASKHAIAL